MDAKFQMYNSLAALVAQDIRREKEKQVHIVKVFYILPLLIETAIILQQHYKDEKDTPLPVYIHITIFYCLNHTITLK